ncbi:MAG: hypothetical protein H7281_09010 [Bacteriovorax sp.]|nr:hypothetical protein [Bacteriovorax sp.]
MEVLEKEEFEKRMEDPKDRRGMLVELTDKGVFKVNEIMLHYLSRLTNFTKVLTTEERNLFHFLMEKIQSG